MIRHRFKVVLLSYFSALKCETPHRSVHLKLIPATTGPATTVPRLRQGQSEKKLFNNSSISYEQCSVLQLRSARSYDHNPK